MTNSQSRFGAAPLTRSREFVVKKSSILYTFSIQCIELIMCRIRYIYLPSRSLLPTQIHTHTPTTCIVCVTQYIPWHIFLLLLVRLFMNNLDDALSASSSLRSLRRFDNKIFLIFNFTDNLRGKRQNSGLYFDAALFRKTVEMNEVTVFTGQIL